MYKPFRHPMAVASAHNKRRRRVSSEAGQPHATSTASTGGSKRSNRDGTGKSEDSVLSFGGQADSLGSTAASGCEQLTESVSRAMRILERMNELIPRQDPQAGSHRDQMSQQPALARPHTYSKPLHAGDDIGSAWAARLGCRDGRSSAVTARASAASDSAAQAFATAIKLIHGPNLGSDDHDGVTGPALKRIKRDAAERARPLSSTGEGLLSSPCPEHRFLARRQLGGGPNVQGDYR